MRAILMSLGVLISFNHVAMADSHIGEDGVKAQTCRECHSPDGVDLTGRGQDTIVAQINAIRAGDTRHPPTMGGLKDEDIAEIAKILDRVD
jgi:cytochrome c553